MNQRQLKLGEFKKKKMLKREFGKKASFLGLKKKKTSFQDFSEGMLEVLNHIKAMTNAL